jgi:hypothetical protein
MMLPAMLEKFGYVATLSVLSVQGRLQLSQYVAVGPDLVFGILFALAFVKTPACRSNGHRDAVTCAISPRSPSRQERDAGRCGLSPVSLHRTL